MIARLIDADAPPERLAMFRILTGVFAVVYVVVRLPVFLELRDRSPSAFEPVGVLAPLDSPLPETVIVGLIAVTLIAGVVATLGLRFRLTAPVFAISLLALTTYRGSWGQLLHFENLFVLHLVVLAFAPGADVWSVDARRLGPRQREPTAYGWPLALLATITVTTYVIAGVAKLRYGGAGWVFGDTLRNHVAYSAGRLELLGGTPSPLADDAVRHPWVFPPLAAGAVAIELLAPVALFGRRLRNLWVVGAWAMHAAIFALMLVGFPYPLFLVAFAPLFPVERLLPERSRAWLAAAGTAPRPVSPTCGQAA